MKRLHLNTIYTRGMTLAEVLVTVSILVVVLIAVTLFQYNIINYNRSTSVSLTNAQEAPNLLKIMAKELRGAAPSANGSYALDSAGLNTITFYADLDGDAVAEQIRYYLTGTTLYRGITESSGSPADYNASDETVRTVITGLANTAAAPIFQYYDDGYSGTTAALTYPLTLTNVKLIKINLIVDSDPSKPPPSRTYSTQVSLRNLKDNL